MADGYNCYQKALAERINGVIKGEYLLQRCDDLVQVRCMVNESIAIYSHL